MPEIDDDRKREIVAEYRKLLQDGMGEEQAARMICEQYNIPTDELDQLVAEIDDDEDDHEPA